MKRLIALCLILLLLLSGCAKEQKEPAQTQSLPEETESQNDVIQTPSAKTEEQDKSFGLSYLPAYGLNPFTCTATANRALFSLMYEGLFTVSHQFRAEPVLCESFRVSDDGRSYRFTLIDAKFTDGTPVTAADVEASIEAAKNSPLYQARLSHIVYYTAEDDKTLLVQLDTPYENLALMLDVPIVKADTVEETMPIGSGPYVSKAGRLVRNSYWWGSEVPAIHADEIVLQVCTEANDLRDNFEFGQTNLVYYDPNSAAAVGYRCDYEVWDVPTTILHYIGFNLYSGYFANDTLRSAVTYIIDREDISNRIYGGYALASVLPCSPNSDLYDNQLAESYDYAPRSFQEALNNSGILSSAEYESHEGLFIVCAEDQTRAAAADYICQVLKSYGLNIRVSILDRESYEEALEDGDFDLYYGEVRLTANFDLSEFFEEGGNLEYGEIANANLATLCEEALENSGSYVELCARLMEQAPICPVIFKSYAANVTRGVITNMVPAVDFVFHETENARTLADADKTYEPEMPDPTQETVEESASEGTEADTP